VWSPSQVLREVDPDRFMLFEYSILLHREVFSCCVCGFFSFIVSSRFVAWLLIT
jgi:hypothetical protein